MEVHDAGSQLEILFRGGWGVAVFAGPSDGVVEGPVFHVTLAALHDGAADSGIPRRSIGSGVGLGEMQVGVGHDLFAGDAVEAQFSVGLFEGEGMGGGCLLAVDDPFVHAPEVAGADVEAECVDDAGDQWQLLGGSNGSANADGVVVGALFPGGDVFEGFGEVEFFEGVVEGDFETGAREALHFLRGEGRGVGHQFRVERGVIPPIRGNARNRTGRSGAGTH